MNLSTDMLLTVAREFMRTMAQPVDAAATRKGLLTQEAVNAIWEQSQQGQQQAQQQQQQQQQQGGVVGAAAPGGQQQQSQQQQAAPMEVG
jgi:hypothetical protein